MPSELQRIAALARAAVDNDLNRSDTSAGVRFNENSRSWIEKLSAAVYREVGFENGQWVISRWLITREPIDQCLAAETDPEWIALRDELRSTPRGQNDRPAGIAGVHHHAVEPPAT